MSGVTRRIVFGSLRRRRGRVVVATCAIALGASLVVEALNLRYGIKERLARELRSYGANLVLVPRTEPFLKESDRVILEDKRLKDRIIGYAPFIHKVAKVDGKDVVLVGARFSQLSKISQWWQIEGRWPEKENEALIGTNAASKLGLRLGDRFSAVHKISQLSLSVTGLLHTGGAEEHQVLVRLETLQRLTLLDGFLTSVLVSSPAGKELEETVAILQKAWPQAEARTLLQVARAEEAILARLEIFLTLVSLLILTAAGLSVYATMSTAALERKVEMALMRALGGEERRVAWIFASEALGMGLIGGILGCAAGLLLSEIIGLSVFGSFFFPSLLSLPIGLALGVGISLFCSLWVMRRILALQPAVVLRGAREQMGALIL